MIYIEEYEVDPSDKEELINMYKDSKKIFDELKLPYLKNYTVYESTETPNKLRGIVIFNEGGTTEMLYKDFMAHPNVGSVLERFNKLCKNVVTESYEVLFPF
jgi:hypothetical protein